MAAFFVVVREDGKFLCAPIGDECEQWDSYAFAATFESRELAERAAARFGGPSYAWPESREVRRPRRVSNGGAMIFVYLIAKHGSDLDGQDRIVEADTAEDADVEARRLEAFYGWTLTLVGTKEGAKFTPCVDYDALPWWAKEWVDEQAPRVTVRRERPSKPAKAKARRMRAERTGTE